MEPPLPSYIHLWPRKSDGEPWFSCLLCYYKYHKTGPQRNPWFHLRSKDHLDKIRRMESLHCTLCDRRFDFNSKYQRHLESKAHKQKEAPPQPRAIIEYGCEICRVKFESNKDHLRHLETRKHKTRANPPTENPNECKACNLVCKYKAQYLAHLATAKHAKNSSKTNACVAIPPDSTPAHTN